jgi:ubiquitin-protein ligase
VDGFKVDVPDESQLFEWDVYVAGPPDTPYDGGIYKAHLSFPKE